MICVKFIKVIYEWFCKVIFLENWIVLLRLVWKVRKYDILKVLKIFFGMVIGYKNVV